MNGMNEMNGRERFLTACRCEPLDRPPVWIMRQAGRYLPEYRRLREDNSFHDVVENPELACEVTLQPLRRYAFDAAILFSDILVIPEAMGQPYGFPEGGGIEMDWTVEDRDDVERLTVDGVAERLEHVGRAISRIRGELDGERALLGFGGSPWTLATYMVEGGSSKHKSSTKALFYEDRETFDALMEKITDALGAYFEMQLDAGVDAIQIFDSWGGVLSPSTFRDASVRWMQRLVERIGDRAPVIVFAKGMHHLLDDLVETGADVLSIDWTANLRDVRDALPDDVAVQGNLDPTIVDLDPDIVERETRSLLDEMAGTEGHIFNLGHGIRPTARPESVGRLVETVTSYPN